MGMQLGFDVVSQATPCFEPVSASQSRCTELVSGTQIGTVYLLDINNAGAGLRTLLELAGIRFSLCSSIEEFAAVHDCEQLACVVGDWRDLFASPLEGAHIWSPPCQCHPIVACVGEREAQVAVRAIKAGACDVIARPYRDAQVIAAIRAAFLTCSRAQGVRRRMRDLRSRFGRLTPRERQVLALVTTGLMNKQIAFDLGLSEITVKVHRGSVMRKMQAKSLAELVRMADALKVQPPVIDSAA